MPNCKPGDLAVIIAPASSQRGRIVEVLHAADPVSWRGHTIVLMPDGSRVCKSSDGPSWVVKMLGQYENKAVNGPWRKMMNYGLILDAHLRPLPGLPSIEEVEDYEQV